MNDLIATTDTMTSIQIAEMIDKQHPHIMRDIRDEIEKLENAGISTESKFGLSERQDSTGRTIPFYTLTREGILQLAARYDAVTRAKLIEMAFRSEQPKPMSELEVLHQMTGALLEQSRQVQQLSGSVETLKVDIQEMREVIELDQTGWREDCTKLVKRIAKRAGGYDKIRAVWTEVHRNIDSRLGANLQRRLENKRMRMATEGIGKTARDSVSILDIIAEDKKLIEGTIHIVKMLAVKNGVRWTEEEMP